MKPRNAAHINTSDNDVVVGNAEDDGKDNMLRKMKQVEAEKSNGDEAVELKTNVGF